jgi:hypothetical protein
MLENYKHNNFENYEKSKLHDKFWNSIIDKKAAKIIRNKLKINISDTFLKKNKSLKPCFYQYKNINYIQEIWLY